MKRVKIFILLASLLTIGCNNKDGLQVGAGSPQPGATPITPGVTITPSAQEADLTIDSSTVLSDFAKWPLNNPVNVKVKVDLRDLGAPSSGGASRYGGSLNIRYEDSGWLMQHPFTTGSTQNDAAYNYWVTMSGKPVFRAFFEDTGRPFKKVSGGLVLVIDNGSGNGDGSGGTVVSGSVWYLNFESSGAPQTDARCWFVQLGPYDCRAFLQGNSVDITSRLYPEARTLSTGYQPGYKRLGVFTNLNINAAFNQ